MSSAPPGAEPIWAGFTLLELLFVLGLIAVLAGLLLGTGRRAAETGRVARARAELVALGAALDAYRQRQGDYPQAATEAEMLQSLLGRLGPRQEPVVGPALIELARYRTEDGRDPGADWATRLVDPWDRPYRYAYKSVTPWSNPGFVLYSLGPDGEDAPALRPGGFADAAAAANADNIYLNRDGP